MQMTLRSAGLGFGAAMLLALTGAANAADSDRLMPGEWQTEAFDRGDGCYTAQVLPDGVMMGFHFMVADQELRLTLSSENWEEMVPEEDTGPVSVAIQTSKGKRQLTTKEGYALHAQGLEAIAGIWLGKEGEAAMSAFAAGSEVEISYQGRSFGTYPLAGADKAIKALKRCVADLDKG